MAGKCRAQRRIRMKFAVIGAGNSGQIMAFDLTQKGAEVSLYTRDAAKAAHLAEHGLTAEGRLEGHVSLHLVTTDMRAAVRGAEVIFIMTTAAGHRPVAEAMKPFLEEGQTIIVFNANWGALEFRQVLAASPAAPAVCIGETGTQLYVGNIAAPGRVFSKQIKQQITLATIAPEQCDAVISRLRDFLPQLSKAANILETSLSSANAAIHVPVCLFNLSRIELGQDFLFYTEGTSRSTVAYIEAIDRERMAVMAALGLETSTMLEILNSFWPDKRETLYDAILENKSYQVVKGPKSLTHRFFTEDIPFGIVPQTHLGRLLGVPTPYMDAMLTAFELFMGPEITATGFRPSLEELRQLTQ